jgi:hypothetical protein
MPTPSSTQNLPQDVASKPFIPADRKQFLPYQRKNKNEKHMIKVYRRKKQLGEFLMHGDASTMCKFCEIIEVPLIALRLMSTSMLHYACLGSFVNIKDKLTLRHAEDFRKEHTNDQHKGKRWDEISNFAMVNGPLEMR